MATEDEVRLFILENSKHAGSKGKLAQWSRDLGFKDGYLHQYVRRKTPRKLDGDVRKRLAQLMNVSVARLSATSKRRT
jgi:hypothetical protein